MDIKISIDTALYYHKDGKILKAVEIYLELLKKDKDNYRVLSLLGAANIQLGNIDKGICYLKKSIQINSNYAAAHINLGNGFKNKNSFEDALNCYNKAIYLEPNNPDVHCNKGAVLYQLKEFSKALESYNKAIEIDNKHFLSHNNKGILLKDLGNFDEALECYKNSININPKNVLAYISKGDLYLELKRYEDALKSFENAIQIDENQNYLLGKYIRCCMFLCKWENFFPTTQKINKLIKKSLKVVDPFTYMSIMDNPEISKLCAEIYSQDKLSIIPLSKKVSLKKSSKLKIGYFSGDFNNHAVMHLIMDVFKNHNKSNFEIFGFSFRPDKDDHWTEKLKKYFDGFNNVKEYTDIQIANLSKKIGIDIAVDLTGFTKSSRVGVFAHRAAPIQINYLGYPGTLGSEFFDYIIADEIIIPKKNSNFFSEKVLYLPNCYQANMSSKQVSEKTITKSELNLPDDKFIFACFNNNYKITPDIFNSWMNILKRVPKSILWLLKSNESSILNLQKEAIKRNVNPERIIFAPPLPNDEHLNRLRLADLFLDSFPYNSHTTASDIVRMGVPIVTVIGNSFASRVCASILTTLKLPELITNNITEYESLAVELALDDKKITKFKNSVKDSAKNSILFDSVNFTRNLEKLYLSL